MKKNYIIVIVFLLFAELLSAQSNYELKKAVDLFRTNKLLSGDSRGLLTENDIKGSPYLEDDFIDGSVFTTSMAQYTDVPLRYNIYNDQLEFKAEDNSIQELATPEIIEKAVFGKYKMVYSPYSIAKKIGRGFFVVLEEGKSSLYLKPQVVFEKATEPAPYKETEPARFVRNPDEYYIKVGTSQAMLVGNKKDLLEIFPDHQKEIETFIKKQKTKTNKPESLKELVQYYNSL
jgi:hypothetical protein